MATTVLSEIGDLFADLAQKVSDDLDLLMKEHPSSDAEVAAWHLQMNRLRGEYTHLQSISTHLYDLDAQNQLGQAKTAIENIKKATADAEATIKTVANINKTFTLVGDFISVGLSVVGVVANPVGGAGGLVTAVSDLTDAIKNYNHKNTEAAAAAAAPAAKKARSSRE